MGKIESKVALKQFFLVFEKLGHIPDWFYN